MEGVKGKTLTGFTVNEKGEITNIKILKKDNKKAAKKAAIIISKLKSWTLGKQRGIAVPVNYTIPFEFWNNQDNLSFTFLFYIKRYTPGIIIPGVYLIYNYITDRRCNRNPYILHNRLHE